MVRELDHTHVYGAAHQGSSTQSFLDDVEQMWTGLPQLVDFSDSSGEILEALGGGSSRQSLVTTVQPATTPRQLREQRRNVSFTCCHIQFVQTDLKF